MFKALLVEDNATFRQTTKDMLLVHFPSMCVTEARNADEAMEEVIFSCPDLIFMDIKLPGKNGLHLTKEIKSLRPYVIVIILTNYDLPEYREAADKYGADYFFVKGTTQASEILASVDSLLPKDSNG